MFFPLWRPSPLLFFTIVKVYSYVPALPSNGTNISSIGIEGRLDVYVYNVTTPTSITLRSAVVPVNYPGSNAGALAHFSDEDGVGVNTGAFNLSSTIILVSCDANSTNPPQEDIFLRARELSAVVGVLYSRYSETCVLPPGYNASDADMAVYLSPSLNTSRAIEQLFNKVDSRYYAWDPETLQSKFHNISYDIPYASQGNLDAGYLIAQTFWNASDAPIITPSPSPTPANRAAVTDGVKAYSVLFSILGGVMFCVLTVA